MDILRPAFILDPAKAKDNIRIMAAKARASGVIFRPHFKTHQSRFIGGWFRNEGVSRITVSSLTMARYFADDGWNDITVAFPVNLPEIGLINDLASRISLGLVVEDLMTMIELTNRLTSPVDIYIKIDSGYHRTGLEPSDKDEIIRIKAAADAGALTAFSGILTHAGNTYSANGPEAIAEIARQSMDSMLRVKSFLGDVGNCLISVGDTPSCSVLENFNGADEIRPGNFVFYDLMQMNIGSCTFSQIAGIVGCPVVAVHPRRRQAVIYGGAVHLSKDRILVEGKSVYGQLVEWDGMRWGVPVENSFLVSLSQEHGILEAPDKVIKMLRPGMIIGIIPVHSCLTANLLRRYHLISGETIDHMEGN
jgi:D-serine deaminase-like pyridoxal phosphate-dependent protein